MVFTFTSSTGRNLLMGENQRENEVLLHHSLPTDVWFHVSSLPSAHIYVRSCADLSLGPDSNWGIDDDTVAECCKIVKGNSIKGCKMKAVKVVASRWSNLVSPQGSEDGVVAFADEGECRYWDGVEKDNGLCRRVEKSWEREDVGKWEGERRAYLEEERRRVKKERKEGERKKKQEEEEERKRKEEMSYDRVFEKIDLNDGGEGAEDLFGDDGGDWGEGEDGEEGEEGEGGGGRYADECDFF
ncbi:hypothetical protein TrRE_jg12086 [Triparma retinervis]|uniref:NFACT RNA-binding domain-containing protein n=1 Tax=Triparma retinervis TaxID=2557542 RepID=A0A9W7FHA9_9STRA|nr:hypothetical protein TrRE_jg12086 [Triparma retinervis]